MCESDERQREKDDARKKYNYGIVVAPLSVAIILRLELFIDETFTNMQTLKCKNTLLVF